MPDVPDGQIIVYLIATLLTSGFAKYLIDIFRERAKARASMPPPAPARQAEIDQSLLAMAKANTQLDEDNERLRETNREIADQLSRERAERQGDREAYQREIRDLEARLREMSQEITRLLRQVGELGRKHDTGDIPAVRVDQQTRRPYQPYDHSHGTPTTEIRED